MLCKSMDWFLYDRNLRHKRLNQYFMKNEFLEEVLHNEIKIRDLHCEKYRTFT